MEVSLLASDGQENVTELQAFLGADKPVADLSAAFPFDNTVVNVYIIGEYDQHPYLTVTKGPPITVHRHTDKRDATADPLNKSTAFDKDFFDLLLKTSRRPVLRTR